jgi:ribosomal protein L16/L10AE
MYNRINFNFFCHTIQTENKKETYIQKGMNPVLCVVGVSVCMVYVCIYKDARYTKKRP